MAATVVAEACSLLLLLLLQASRIATLLLCRRLLLPQLRELQIQRTFFETGALRFNDETATHRRQRGRLTLQHGKHAGGVDGRLW